ncbi:MAG: hypothetical protein ACFE0J_08545 [Elainellaceae cyanobacterium]
MRVDRSLQPGEEIIRQEMDSANAAASVRFLSLVLLRKRLGLSLPAALSYGRSHHPSQWVHVYHATRLHTTIATV